MSFLSVLFKMYSGLISVVLEGGCDFFFSPWFLYHLVALFLGSRLEKTSLGNGSFKWGKAWGEITRLQVGKPYQAKQWFFLKWSVEITPRNMHGNSSSPQPELAGKEATAVRLTDGPGRSTETTCQHTVLNWHIYQMTPRVSGNWFSVHTAKSNLVLLPSGWFGF